MYKYHSNTQPIKSGEGSPAASDSDIRVMKIPSVQTTTATYACALFSQQTAGIPFHVDLRPRAALVLFGCHWGGSHMLYLAAVVICSLERCSCLFVVASRLQSLCSVRCPTHNRILMVRRSWPSFHTWLDSRHGCEFHREGHKVVFASLPCSYVHMHNKMSKELHLRAKPWPLLATQRYTCSCRYVSMSARGEQHWRWQEGA